MTPSPYPKNNPGAWRLLAWTLLFFVSVTLSAQITSPEKSAVRVEFTALGWERSLNGISYRSGGQTRSMYVPMFARSTPQTYTGDPLLSFYQEEANRDQAPEHRLIGQVTLPPAAERVLLVFVPATDTTWRILALPEQPDSQPAGYARIFNATLRTVKVKNRAGLIETIAPGDQALMAGNGRTLSLQVAVEAKGQWQLVTSNVFGLRADQRITVFLAVSDSDYFHLTTADGGKASPTPLQAFGITD